MSKLTDLISQVEKKDAALAEELRKEVSIYAKRRPFGLNFERHQPENVRLYGRPAHIGDLVNVLPERGQTERAENKRKWQVISIDGDSANLVSVDGEEPEEQNVSIDDLVVLSEFNRPIFPGLKETGRVERGGEKPYQVVINGENYHALETLLYAYEGNVDCIYIDPPYNTRDKDWKYNNDYVDSTDEYKHSKWLAMMERRLKLARRLLNPNKSVMIVAIDEKEQARLALLLEQLFSGDTIQMITIVTNPKGSARKGRITRCDEYLFFVYRGYGVVLEGEKDYLFEEQKRKVRWPSLKRTGTNSMRVDRANLFYPLIFDAETNRFIRPGDSLALHENRALYELASNEIAVWPLDTNGGERIWQLSQDSLMEYLEKGFVNMGRLRNGTATPYYLSSGLREKIDNGEIIITGYDADGVASLEYSDGYKKESPKSTWNTTAHSASESGTNLLKLLVPDRPFPFPKSLYAVEDAIRAVVSDNSSAVVLDFFAGSGTTSHAVMRLNRQDGGLRRCICVTNNEVSADEADRLASLGYRQGDSEWESLGICEYITKPRIKAAITGETPEGDKIQGDYKFKDEFPMSDGFEENAVFFDLTYQDEIDVELDQAFEEIAPILWMRAGSQGRCISEQKPDFDIAETYAVLFDYKHSNRFLKALDEAEGIKVVYIVTDQDSRFQDVAQRLPKGTDSVRLYESYLRSFKINQGEA